MLSDLRDIICSIIFWIMAAIIAIVLVYPWHPAWPAARRLLHLPVLLLLLWVVYELIMPPEMNIRVDLLFLLPGILVALLLYAVKYAIFRKLRT